VVGRPSSAVRRKLGMATLVYRISNAFSFFLFFAQKNGANRRLWCVSLAGAMSSKHVNNDSQLYVHTSTPVCACAPLSIWWKGVLIYHEYTCPHTCIHPHTHKHHTGWPTESVTTITRTHTYAHTHTNTQTHKHTNTRTHTNTMQAGLGSSLVAVAVSSFCSGAEGSGGLMEVSPHGMLALLEGLRAAAALEGKNSECSAPHTPAPFLIRLPALLEGLRAAAALVSY